MYKRQKRYNDLTLFSDSDWAGCPLTRKSASGTICMFGLPFTYSQSSTQAPIIFSSGEAESYAIVKVISRDLGFRHLAGDLLAFF